MTDDWTRWGERVEKRISAQRKTVENLTTALRDTLRRERADRAREVGALRAELRQLREQLDTQARLTELQARLDKIESSPSRGAGLRAV
jgi:hypothetical protein